MQDRVRPGRTADLADDQHQQQRAQGVQDTPGGDLAAGKSPTLGPAGRQAGDACAQRRLVGGGMHVGAFRVDADLVVHRELDSESPLR
jgi:hypothetical protein